MEGQNQRLMNSAILPTSVLCKCSLSSALDATVNVDIRVKFISLAISILVLISIVRGRAMSDKNLTKAVHLRYLHPLASANAHAHLILVLPLKAMSSIIDTPILASIACSVRLY